VYFKLFMSSQSFLLFDKAAVALSPGHYQPLNPERQEVTRQW